MLLLKQDLSLSGYTSTLFILNATAATLTIITPRQASAMRTQGHESVHPIYIGNTWNSGEHHS